MFFFRKRQPTSRWGRELKLGRLHSNQRTNPKLGKFCPGGSKMGVEYVMFNYMGKRLNVARVKQKSLFWSFWVLWTRVWNQNSKKQNCRKSNVKIRIFHPLLDEVESWSLENLERDRPNWKETFKTRNILPQTSEMRMESVMFFNILHRWARRVT
jgi:hypothetical protein